MIAVACTTVSALYVLSMLAVTGGHFVPQVADLYLIAQYAKGFAEGHPFQYNPGEAPTTGATSLLHTALLGLAHALGFRGEGLIAFAILSGAAFMFLTALQAHRASLCLGAERRVALLGVLLVVLNGPLAWSFHYGADIALVLFLSTWLFAAWVGATAEGSSTFAFVLPACLLALTRPEAAILVTGLGAFALWEARERPLPLIHRLRFLLPALVAGLVLGVLRLVTGSATNTSFSQKLLAENRGFFSAAVVSIEYWSDVLRGLLLGFYPSSQRIGLGGGEGPFYAPPLLLVFVFLAFMRSEGGHRRVAMFLSAALVTALAITPTIHVGFHFNRYLLFALPPLLVLMALGLGAAADFFGTPNSRSRETAFRGLSALALTFSVISVFRFALIYGDNASSVFAREEALFSFIRRNLPEDTLFLNNATAIEYSTSRRSLNLGGVVTPAFASVLPAETESAAFEILSRSPKAELPRYLIAPEDYARDSGLRILVGGPPVYVTSSLQVSELAIYPLSSELLGLQHTPQRLETPEGLVLTDALNVGEPESERLHGYRFQSSVGTRSLFAALTTDRYRGERRGAGLELADGGRLIMGAEEFDLATPGRGEVWLAMRTHPEPVVRLEHPTERRRVAFALGENRIRFSTRLGSTDWLPTPLEAGWNEIGYRLPENLVEGDSTRVKVEGRFSSFIYWAFRKPK